VKVLRSEAYAQWIDNLKDSAGRARVLMKVDRLILLLLAGGSKATQAKDIARALELNRSFLSDSQ
jgi:putative component of toxin-antitoxin plasmid stabilization module